MIGEEDGMRGVGIGRRELRDGDKRTAVQKYGDKRGWDWERPLRLKDAKGRDKSWD